MKDFVRFVGSAVIALILVSIPGLLAVSISLEWHGFLKTLLCISTAAAAVLITFHIYKRSKDEHTD